MYVDWCLLHHWHMQIHTFSNIRGFEVLMLMLAYMQICSSVGVKQWRFAVIEPVLLFCKQTRMLKVHLWLHLHLKDFGSRLSEILNSVWWCLLSVWHNYIKHNFSIAKSSSRLQCLKIETLGNTRRVSSDVYKFIFWIPKAFRLSVFCFSF